MFIHFSRQQSGVMTEEVFVFCIIHATYANVPAILPPHVSSFLQLVITSAANYGGMSQSILICTHHMYVTDAGLGQV